MAIPPSRACQPRPTTPAGARLYETLPPSRASPYICIASMGVSRRQYGQERNDPQNSHIVTLERNEVLFLRFGFVHRRHTFPGVFFTSRMSVYPINRKGRQLLAVSFRIHPRPFNPFRGNHNCVQRDETTFQLELEFSVKDMFFD